MDKWVKLDEIIDALWKNEKAHTPDGYNDSLFDDIKKLPTKTIDEGFKVGDEVWYIDKYSKEVTEKCKCCGTTQHKAFEKRTYIPEVKSRKIEAILIEEDVTTYYCEYYIGYYGENDISEIDFENDEYFKTKEEAEAKLKEVEGE